MQNVKALGNKFEAGVLKPIKNANVFGNNFEEVAVGSVAPDFTLKSLDGTNIRLAEQRGKTVLITFWASWCSPCRIELPHFQKLQRNLGKDKITVLAVSADSRLEDVTAFSKELALTIPMLFDPGLNINQLYRVRAMPTTFIVDSSGVIRNIHMGFKESVLPLYEKELRALINE
jgi:peroxiredoxin